MHAALTVLVALLPHTVFFLKPKGHIHSLFYVHTYCNHSPLGNLQGVC